MIDVLLVFMRRRRRRGRMVAVVRIRKEVIVC
jgi:hypothetical protein